MKRAPTHLFKRQSENRAFFKIIELYFDLRPPGQTRARQRSENPTPRASRMCESPGVARGGGWSGLELTDTLGQLITTKLNAPEWGLGIFLISNILNKMQLNSNNAALKIGWYIFLLI